MKNTPVEDEWNVVIAHYKTSLFVVRFDGCWYDKIQTLH